MDNNYEYHCENLRALEKAITNIELTLRNYLSIRDEVNSKTYTRILSHLVNSWVEVRLLKLVYEPDAFTDEKKLKILSPKLSLEERWKAALNSSFCKAFSIKDYRKIVTSPNVQFGARKQYEALNERIEKDLLPSYEVRNRVAHGQWIYAFTTDLLNINEDLMRDINTENILVLQFRLALFKSLAQIIHDLAVSKKTFERDFNDNYKKIEAQLANAKNVSIRDYQEKMVLKKQRGLAKKKLNQKLD